MCSTAIDSPAVALPCPLCCQTNFPSVDSLRISLVSVSSRLLQCPICAEMLMGLDKLTIHLFSHTLISGSSSSSNSSGHTKSISNINSNINTSSGVTSSSAYRPNKQHQWHRAVAPAQNGDAAHGTRALAARNTSPPVHVSVKAQCYLCGCTFRSHELHHMHMQLVHDVTVADACDDDPQSDSDSAHNVAMSDAEHHSQDFNQQQQQQHPFQQQHMPTGGRNKLSASSPSATSARFECNMCPKSFKLKGSLRVHLRVVHAVDSAANGQMSVGGGGVDALSSMVGPASVSSGHPHAAVYDVGRQCNGVTSMDGVATTSNDAAKEMGSNEPSGGCDRGGGSGTMPPAIDAAAKLWECDICAKWFTTKYFLKKHKRLHTGEMPYTCEHCGKTFTFQQSYHKHLLYHTDDKPHVCLTCGRAFKEMSTLHNHERIHSGEKPFKCETCDKCFRQRVSYLVHRRIHTGVMPYKCTACDKSFRYKVSQRTHKCLAQPPGEVVRQTGDLLQRLIQSSIMLNETSDGSGYFAGDISLELSTMAAMTGLTATTAITEQLHSDLLDRSQPNEIELLEMPIIKPEEEDALQHMNTFPTNQALDAFVVEHCNMIGIADDHQQLLHKEQQEQQNQQHHRSMHPDEDSQPVPSPSSQFQNMCLYSPTTGHHSHQQGDVDASAVISTAPAEPYTSALDALDEVALSNFMNEIN